MAYRIFILTQTSQQRWYPTATKWAWILIDVIQRLHETFLFGTKTKLLNIFFCMHTYKLFIHLVMNNFVQSVIYLLRHVFCPGTMRNVKSYVLFRSCFFNSMKIKLKMRYITTRLLSFFLRKTLWKNGLSLCSVWDNEKVTCYARESLKFGEKMQQQIRITSFGKFVKKA